MRRRGAAGELAAIRAAGLYRRPVEAAVRGARVRVGGRDLINMCSNDYLGLRPAAVPASQMQSSSRLLAGSDPGLGALEAALARHKSQKACLVYPAGYMANLGALQGMARPGDLVLSDELNHASIIDACRLAGCRVRVYPHNDMGALDAGLRAPAPRKIIVTEGIFSMDGDTARLREAAEIAGRRGALLALDDAHGDFAVGRDGKGTASLLGAARRVDAYVSSLSKALGSFGGYVACGAEWAELQANRSRAFIYTSALPAALARHAAARLRSRSRREARRRRLARNARRLAAGVQRLGLGPATGTHIMPVMAGPERRAVGLARALAEGGVFAQAIRYPTVPRGAARVRLSATAWLTDADVDAVIEALGRAARKAGL